MKKFMTAGLLVAALSAGAWADHGDGNKSNANNGNNGNNGNAVQNQSNFESSLVGSVPAVSIGGVNSGGAPWVVAGSAEVSASGRIEVDMTGLLITSGPGVPPNLVGTVGPVKMVAASLVCGGSGGSVAASTDGVALSTLGNAHIEGTLTLPAACMAPVVLVRIFNAAAAPGSQLGPFIAVSGLTASSSEMQNGGQDGDR